MSALVVVMVGMVMLAIAAAVTAPASAQLRPPNTTGFMPDYAARDIVTASTSSLACAILTNNATKCWGANSFGQAGYPPRLNVGKFPDDLGDRLRDTPLGTGLTVSAKDHNNGTTISSATAYTCAVLAPTHVIKCWGWGRLRALQGQTDFLGAGQREMGDNLPALNLSSTHPVALQVSVGNFHMCAVLTTPTFATTRLKCWGSNALGQLGLGDFSGSSVVNLAGDNLPFVNFGPSDSDNVVSVSVGYQHTCAVVRMAGVNRVHCFGDAANAQTGLGLTTSVGAVAGQMGTNLTLVDLGNSSSVTWGGGVAELRAGFFHTCVRFADGNVKCWGNRFSGRNLLGLGAGITDAGSTPASMGNALPFLSFPGGRLATSLAVASFASCAALNDGSVACWGDDAASGSTGLGGVFYGTPQLVNLGTGVMATDVASSPMSYHMCAVLGGSLAGQVKCWGTNSEGQLFTGSSANVVGLSLSQMGDALPTMGLSSSTTWRNVSSATRGSANGIAASRWSACVVVYESPTTSPSASSPTQKLYCVGQNTVSSLGSGQLHNAGSSFAQMGADLPRMMLGAGHVNNVKQVALAESTSCVLLNSGPASRMKCMGVGQAGQLLNANTTLRGASWSEFGDALPFAGFSGRADGLTIARLQSSGWGQGHFCVIVSSGDASCFGSNQYGQLMLGSVNAIGDNSNEVGDGIPVVSFGPNPQDKVADVVTGYVFSCVLLRDGSVRCAGSNANGQLGLGLPVATMGDAGGQTGANLPRVDLGPGVGATQIAAGYEHVCVVGNDTAQANALRCWGRADKGRLGLMLGTGVPSWGTSAAHMGSGLPSVSLGSDVSRVVSVSAGLSHTCVLLQKTTGGSGNHIKCFGDNAFGQIGVGSSAAYFGWTSGTMGDALPFVNVGTGLTAFKVVAGYQMTCALRSDLRVVCWGSAGSALGTGQFGGFALAAYGTQPGHMGDGLPVVDLSDGNYVPLPTPSPSKAPTMQPSASPSKLPTTKPSKSPTRQPTTKPSKSPTNKPTRRPSSKAPTRNPSTRTPTTRAPTRKPGSAPWVPFG